MAGTKYYTSIENSITKVYQGGMSQKYICVKLQLRCSDCELKKIDHSLTLNKLEH